MFPQLILLSYCFINGDTSRVINGYDKCGNICGKENIMSNVSDCGVIIRLLISQLNDN